LDGHKITHIRKKKAPRNCQSITNVQLNRKTNLSVADVIKMMSGKSRDSLPHQFYIEVNGQRLPVRAVPENDPYYIRTEQDDGPYDNLLSLPSF
jgi:hypothetical protein